MNIIKSLFLLVVLLAMQISVAEIRVVGYVPTWIDFPAFVNQLDYTRLTHVNVAFYNPTASGNLVSDINDLSGLISKAHAANTKVLVSLGGAAVDSATWADLLTAQKVDGFVTKIVDFMTAEGLDGMDVDLEGGLVESVSYERFISKLAPAIKAKGKLITCALGVWYSQKVTSTALGYFDFVNVMSYDKTGSWSGEGQHSPYSMATDDAAYYLGRGVAKNKIVVGVPFYGHGFQGEADYISYADILSAHSDAWSKDVVSHTYYNGMETIRQKTLFANDYGGIMIWEVSQDAPGPYSLLETIYENIDWSQNSSSSSTSSSSNTTALNFAPGITTESMTGFWLFGQNEMEIRISASQKFETWQNTNPGVNATYKIFDVNGGSKISGRGHYYMGIQLK